MNRREEGENTTTSLFIVCIHCKVLKHIIAILFYIFYLHYYFLSFGACVWWHESFWFLAKDVVNSLLAIFHLGSECFTRRGLAGVFLPIDMRMIYVGYSSNISILVVHVERYKNNYFGFYITKIYNFFSVI